MLVQWIELISKRYALILGGFLIANLSAFQASYAQGKPTTKDHIIEKELEAVEGESLDLDGPSAPVRIQQTGKINEPVPIPGEPKYLLEARRAQQKKDFKKVIELLWPNVNSLNPKSLIVLARAYTEEKKWTDVLKVTQLGLAKDAKSSDLYAYQGNAQFELGKDKAALEDLKTALNLNPTDEKTYLMTAKIYEKRKNNYELRAIYQDMIEKIGPKGIYYAALCKIDTEDIVNDSALRNCNEALKRNSKDIESSIYLGTVYSHTGKSKEAEELLKKTARMNPKSEIAQQYAGKFYEDKSNYMAAIPYYQKCISINSKSETCLIGASNSEVQVQKFADAYKNITKLCTINRKYSVNARKAIVVAKSFKNSEWEKKFSDLATTCTL